METTPLERLERWELFGAIWRVRSLDATEAVVELCTCDGELVEELRSHDPDLLRCLADRTSSDAV
jgi:hypothetical protein